MTIHSATKTNIYTIYIALLAVLLTSLSSGAYAKVSCGEDYKGATIQGACPKDPIDPIETKCEPLIKRYNDALFVPIPHPDDPTVTLDSMVIKSTEKFRSRKKISAHEVNAITPQMRELGDDPNGEECKPGKDGKPSERCKACDKIVDKGNNACLWRLEDGICSAGTAAAAAAGPGKMGEPKLFNGEAENVCESQPTVPHAPNSYADVGAQTLTANGEIYTMPDDPTQLAMVMGTYDFALDAEQGLLDATAFDPGNLEKITNMMGLKMPFTKAGQFNKQAAKQFAPSLDGLLGSVQKQIMDKVSGAMSGVQGKASSQISGISSQINKAQSATSKLDDSATSKQLKDGIDQLKSNVADLKSDSKINELSDIANINKKTESISSGVEKLTSLASKIPGGGDIAGQLKDMQGQLGQLSQMSDLSNIPALDQFQGMLSNMMNSLVGGFGWQTRKDLSDHRGTIGPSVFNSNAKHVYDRKIKATAMRSTPAFATYDPADYKPGQEKRMAVELAKKTPEELMQAGDLQKLLGNDAYAFGGSSGNIMEQVLPFVKDNVSMGNGVEKYLSNGEMSLASFGLKLSGGGLGDSVSSKMSGNTTLAALKSTDFSQIFNATDMFAPRAALRLFPERDHVSPCMKRPGQNACKVTKDYLPYPYGDKDLNAAYHFSEDDAMRCSGTLTDVIRVDVLNNRYREFNSHQMQRNTYNRWCKGDPKGCCITCTCPPKPCPPSVPCWSKACWGVPIHAEAPPCAMRHDPVHDKGFDLKDPGVNYRGEPNRYCYHKRVQKKLFDWMKRTGGKVDIMGTPAKRIEEVCHDTAKPLPGINKVPMGDIRELAKNGLDAPEGSTWMEQLGRRRPYLALDTTGKELQQAGARPDYFSDAGSFVGAMTGGLKSKLLAAKQGRGPNRLATNNIVPDFGFTDGGLGIVKSVLAQGASGGASGGQCCYGGQGGATGGGCGPDGAHPFASNVELLVQQRRTAQWFNQPCIPSYEKTWNILSPSVMASQMAAGGDIQRIIEDKLDLKSEGAEQADKALIRSVNWPGAFRGHAQSSKKPYPDDGGCDSPKIETGFDSLVEKLKSDEVGACVIMMPRGGALDGEKPGLPNLAVVTRGTEDETGPYADVVMTNIGTGPDRCGINQGAGARVNRRFRGDKLPKAVEQEMEEAKKNAAGTVKDSCVNSWSECKISKNVKWLCFSEEQNQCVQANAGGADKNKLASKK